MLNSFVRSWKVGERSMPTTPRIPQGILRRRPWSANDRKIQEGRPSCETQRDVDQGGAASVRIWIGDDGLDSRDGEYERLRCLQMSEEKQGGHVIQMEDETWQKVQTMKKTWIFDLLITLITVTVLKTPFSGWCVYGL